MNAIHLNIDQNTEVGKAFLQMIRSTAKLYKEITITEDYIKEEKFRENLSKSVKEAYQIRTGKKSAKSLETFLNEL